MALFAVGIKSRDGRQSRVYASTEGGEGAIREAVASQNLGLEVEGVTVIDDDAWFITDREGIIVKGEDEEDVEFPEPIMQFPESEVDMWGSDSALDVLTYEPVSGVSGFKSPVDESAQMDAAAERTDALETLSKDDLARIADALQLAWDNANAGSHKNRDKAIRAVLRGMAGAYSETLAKVEAILDPAATLADFG